MCDLDFILIYWDQIPSNFYAILGHYEDIVNNIRIQNVVKSRAVASSIIGGADIHIFVFTNHKNNWFQKKLIVQNLNIWISAPPPSIIELATTLVKS